MTSGGKASHPTLVADACARSSPGVGQRGKSVVDAGALLPMVESSHPKAE